MRPMPSDPEVIRFIEETESWYPADSNLDTIEENRRVYDAMAAAFRAPRPDSISVNDRTVDVPGIDRSVPVRDYLPGQNVRPDNAHVLFFHGGGIVVGDLESHDDVCAEIAATTGSQVTAVDYCRIPEYTYADAMSEIEGVYRITLEASRPVLLCGDSGGGLLAAALCHRIRRLGLRAPVGQVLIYPALGGDMSKGSYVENAEAPLLRTEDCYHYLKMVESMKIEGTMPAGEMKPLHADDFSDLPPAFLASAQLDPVRDDAPQYVEKLKAAGVQAEWRNEDQLVHGYLRARHGSHRAAEAFAAICSAITVFFDQHQTRSI